MPTPDSLEIFINEQRAELGFFRILLHVFLVRLIASNPATAEERLQDMKNTTMGAVGRMQADPSDQGENRMKAMVSMRADAFFADMEALFAEARRKTSTPGDKH